MTLDKKYQRLRSDSWFDWTVCNLMEPKDLEIPAGSLRLHSKFNGCMLISCKIEL